MRAIVFFWLLTAAVWSEPMLDLQVDPSQAVLLVGQREIEGRSGVYPLSRDAFPDNKNTRCPLVLHCDGYADLALGQVSWLELSNGLFLPGSHSLVLAPRSLAAHFRRRPWLWLVCAGLLALGAEAGLRHWRSLQLSRKASDSLAKMVAGENVSDPMLLTVLGRYRVVAPLGHGGMASVYRAVPKDRVDESEAVALKIIRPLVCWNGQAGATSDTRSVP